MKKILSRVPVGRKVAVFFFAITLAYGAASVVGPPHRASAATNDATLSALSSDIGALSPSFDPATLNYYLLVPQDVATIPTISATTTDPDATDTITQVPPQPQGVCLVGGPCPDQEPLIQYLTGQQATVTVVSADGSATETYTVTFVPEGTLFLSPALSASDTLSATIADDTIASTTSGSSTVNVYIPAGTTVSSGLVGTVAGISGTTLMVTGGSGTTYTVDASNATILNDNGISFFNDIGLGDTVSVQGAVDGTSVTATTVVDNPSTWDGLLYPPMDDLSTALQPKVIYTTSSTVTISALQFFGGQPLSSIDIGSGDMPLSFTNHAVRIDFVGGATSGTVGFTYDWNAFTPITNECSADSQAVGDALAPGTACYINVGSDLVVWTTHFSSYTSTGQSTVAPTTGSLEVTKNAIGGDGTFSFSSSDGSTFSITTQGGTGSNIITDLAPGTYSVKEGKEPKGWKQVDDDCSNVTVTAGGISSCVITDIAAGTRLGEIRGTVYKNKARLPNVRVYLDLNDSGKFKKGDPSTFTDSSGRYWFLDLPPGDYNVREVVPKNLEEIVPAGGVYNIDLAVGEISKGNKFVDTK